MNRAILLGTAGAAIIAGALGVNYAINREEAAVPPAADIASTAPAPAGEAGGEPATAPAEQPEATTPAAETASDAAASPPPGPAAPQFDIVRVEPTGGAVIAGRAAPDSQVTVLLNGQPAGAVTADTRGEWVLLPDKPLPPGSHELSLSSVLGGAPPVASEEMVVVVVPEPNRDIAGRETGTTGQALALLVPRDGDGASTVLQVPPATAQPPVEGESASASASADGAPADPAAPAEAEASIDSGADADSAAAAAPETARLATDGSLGETVTGVSGDATSSPDAAAPRTDADAAAALAGESVGALAGTQAGSAPAPGTAASPTAPAAAASGETSGAAGEVSAAPAPAEPSDSTSSSTVAATSEESSAETPASGAAAEQVAAADAAETVPGQSTASATIPPADTAQPGVDDSLVPETDGVVVAGAAGEASTPPAEGSSVPQAAAAAAAGDGGAVVSGATAAGQAGSAGTSESAGDPAAVASTDGADPGVAAEGAPGAEAPLPDGTAAMGLDSSPTTAAAPLPGTPVAAAAAALTATQAIGEGVTSGGLVLDSVDYDATGNVVIGGRAEPGSILQVYLDNSLIGTAYAQPTGRWHVKPERPVDEGLHTLRVDQVHQEGQVVARVESPFSRAEPVTALPGQTVVIVQPGNSLWRIARRSYGDGLRYSVLYQANRSQIANPDLIYPGQVFVVPNIVQN